VFALFLCFLVNFSPAANKCRRAKDFCYTATSTQIKEIKLNHQARLLKTPADLLRYQAARLRTPADLRGYRAADLRTPADLRGHRAARLRTPADLLRFLI